MLNTKPTISVIVPVYNVDKFLNQCIDSILKQTFKDFELILVNDGSFDYSYKICIEYKELDPRVRVFSQDNKGAGASRNRGIEESIGEFITFIDSDDYVTEDYLEKLYNAIKKYNVDISMTQYYRYNSENNMLYYYLKEEDYRVEVLNQRALFEGMLADANFLQVCAKMYRKSLFNHVRFPEDAYFEDFSTIAKLFALTSNIVFVRENLYCYRTNPNSIVNTPVNFKKVDDHLKWYEEIILVLSLYKIDILGFVNQYRFYLETYKNTLEEKRLNDNNLYHKICSRLDFIKNGGWKAE